MFGFQGGEGADTVARKKGYIKDAQQKWRFLTNCDLSSIKDRGSPLLNGQNALGNLRGTGETRRWCLDAGRAILMLPLSLGPKTGESAHMTPADRAAERKEITIRDIATPAWMMRLLRRSGSTQRIDRTDANDLDQADNGGGCGMTLRRAMLRMTAMLKQAPCRPFHRVADRNRRAHFGSLSLCPQSVRKMGWRDQRGK
jgi:hypothetical protein